MQESNQDLTMLALFYERMKRLGRKLVLIAILIMPVFAVMFDQLQSDPQPDMSKLGVHLLLDDGRGAWPVDIWPEHIEAAADMLSEGGYVVQLVRADDLDIERWQYFMDLCTENNLMPIIRLASVYDHDAGLWLAPVADDDGGYTTIAQQYADFVAGLEWPTEQHYVILLNEPNRGDEWGGQPDPAAYAHFLQETAALIHAADENAQILNAALDLYAPNTGSQPFTPGGYYYIDANTFMDAMMEAVPDVFESLDVWNSHSYPMGAFIEGPWRQTYQFDAMNDATIESIQPPRGVFNRGINGYEWELWKLNRMGIRDLSVMITETGWRRSEGLDSDSLDAGNGYPDGETAALYLDLAMVGNNFRYGDLPNVGWTPWLLDERVIAVTPFAFDGTPVEWSHTNWLQVDENGTILDITPLYDLIAGYKQATTP